MKTKLLGVVLFALSVIGCQDDSVLSPKEPCERDQTGTLKVNNTSSNPYDIYIDGEYVKRVPGKSNVGEIPIKQGSRKLRAIQVSGYILYPTEVTADGTVATCKETFWQIP